MCGSKCLWSDLLMLHYEHFGTFYEFSHDIAITLVILKHFFLDKIRVYGLSLLPYMPFFSEFVINFKINLARAGCVYF